MMHCRILQSFGYDACAKLLESDRKGLIAQVSTASRGLRNREVLDDPFIRR